MSFFPSSGHNISPSDHAIHVIILHTKWQTLNETLYTDDLLETTKGSILSPPFHLLSRYFLYLSVDDLLPVACSGYYSQAGPDPQCPLRFLCKALGQCFILFHLNPHKVLRTYSTVYMIQPYRF